MSTLTLQSRRREKRNQTYFDFVVDGVSLYDLLRPGDMVSCLGWPGREFEEIMAARLLLDSAPDLESGRVELYVCGECADIGCGAITARITVSGGDKVQWSEFGYENDYDPAFPDTKRYASIGPFTFDLHSYREAIKKRWSESGV